MRSTSNQRHAATPSGAGIQFRRAGQTIVYPESPTDDEEPLGNVMRCAQRELSYPAVYV